MEQRSGDGDVVIRAVFWRDRKILNDEQVPKKNAATRVGFAGIVWPSILWPDDAASATMDVGAARRRWGGINVRRRSARTFRSGIARAINIELKKGYEECRQQSLVDELTSMLEKEPKTDAALNEFRTKLAELIGSEPMDAPLDRKSPDYAEGSIGQLSDSRWRDFLDRPGRKRPDGAIGWWRGGARRSIQETLGRCQERLTHRHVLANEATCWNHRADGTRRHRACPARGKATNTRIHLLGHSFGARLVSFSLSGLPQTAAGATSPVKSLFLLQGAFSHYAFAERLPHDASRSGALRGMTDRVDGPLMTTHSLKDLAVGLSYPVASFLNQDDAAAAIDQSIRWGAMGHDGAQAVDAATAVLERLVRRISSRSTSGSISTGTESSFTERHLPARIATSCIHILRGPRWRLRRSCNNRMLVLRAASE